MDISVIIKDQILVLSELDKILNKEQEVLIKDKSSEVISIIEEKKSLAKKIAIIEKKRIELYGDRTSEELLDAGLADKEDIDKLKELIISIREKSETNLILTKQSLNYIRTITSALNPNQKVVTYGNSGKIGNPSSKGVFTTKV